MKPRVRPNILRGTFLFLIAAAALFGAEAPAPVGMFLPGDRALPAASALRDYSAGGIPETEIIFDEQGRPFLSTTHFIVVLRTGVHVGEVNDALRASNARITSMAKKGRTLEIRIPDPERKRGLSEVQALAAALRRRPPFEDALPLSFTDTAIDSLTPPTGK